MGRRNHYRNFEIVCALIAIPADEWDRFALRGILQCPPVRVDHGADLDRGEIEPRGNRSIPRHALVDRGTFDEFWNAKSDVPLELDVL